MKPLFSILIPAYKGRWLSDALRSAVSQQGVSLEVIVIDDASPEDLGALVRPLAEKSPVPVRFSRNGKGCGARAVTDNWNRCLAKAAGEWVVCIGDDDILPPGALAGYAELMARYPQADVFHARTLRIGPDGNVLGENPVWPATLLSQRDFLLRRLEGENQYIGDFCLRRSALLEQGGFASLPYAWGSDDLTVFAAARKGIAQTAAPAFCYREHPGSLSCDSRVTEGKLEAIAAACGRVEPMAGALGIPAWKVRRCFRRRQVSALRQDILSGRGTLPFWWRRRREFSLDACCFALLCKQLLLRHLKNFCTPDRTQIKKTA